jgi:hypothetical protein
LIECRVFCILKSLVAIVTTVPLIVKSTFMSMMLNVKWTVKTLLFFLNPTKLVILISLLFAFCPCRLLRKQSSVQTEMSDVLRF